MTEGLVCRECGAPVDRTIDFCTECGAYLGWAEEPAEADVGTAPVVAVAPAPPHVAAPAEPVAPTPRVRIEGGTICPACGVSNPPERTFCSHCAAPLTGQSRTTTPIPVVSSAPARRRRGPPLFLIVVVLVLVAAGVVLVNRGGDDKESASPPPTTVAPSTTVTAVPTTAPRAPTRIDPSTITASATSTLPDEAPYTYGIKNTLDGNLETAWNDGAPGAGAGEKLTYRFRSPVDVKTIGLINGYASTPELFKQNARIRDMVVVTDFARFPVTLSDSLARQELNLAFGRTASVVIEIVSVYPGNRYDDLALTEIDFAGVA